MSYSFLDAYSSVQSADSSVISGTTLRPKIDIASVLSAVPVNFSGSPSISGAVTVVGTPSISGAVTIVGNASVSGTVNIAGNPSISGTVNIAGTPSISGTVNIGNNASVSGTVNIAGNPSISGTVNIAGNPSISGTVNIAGTPSISGAVTVIGTPSVFVSNPVTVIPQPSSLVSGVTSVITGTASVLVIAAAPASQRNYVTQLLVTNAAAAGTFVNIVDNGTVIYVGYAAASGGGFSAAFPTPLKQPTTALALYAAPQAQASIIVSASGYTAA